MSTNENVPPGNIGAHDELPPGKHPKTTSVETDNDVPKPDSNPYAHYKPKNFKSLRTKQITPKRYYLARVFHNRTYAGIIAQTGVGKSYFSLYIAVCLVLGIDCMHWKYVGPEGGLRVGLVEGEMDETTTRDRLLELFNWLTDEQKDKLDENLFIYNKDEPEFKDGNFPYLDTNPQFYLDEVGKTKPDVLVFDNHACLVENQGKSNDVQPYKKLDRELFIPLRSQGIMTLIIYHMGKDKEKGARGSSSSIDAMNLTLELSPYYVEGAEDRGENHIQVKVGKFREERGPDTKTFVASYKKDSEGGGKWSSNTLTLCTREKVKEVYDNLHEEAQKTGTVPSASQIAKCLKETGTSITRQGVDKHLIALGLKEAPKKQHSPGYNKTVQDPFRKGDD